MNKVSKRQSNIELLRIISMIMVIAHHLSYRGGFEFDTNSITINRLWTQFLMYGGHIGVAVFVLISGYFMIEQMNLRIERIARIWLQMFFYSVLGYVVGVYVFGAQYSLPGIGYALTPFTMQIWGFASAYLVLSIIAPFYNILLRQLSKNQYRLFILVTCGLWLGFPTFTTRLAEGNYFIVLTVIYAIGGYIKLYPEDFSGTLKKYILLTIGFSTLNFLFTVIMDFISLFDSRFSNLATHFTGINHINIVLWAVLLFVTFLKINLKSSTLINGVAGLVFGVYLLHDCYYMREPIWNTIFNDSKLSHSVFLIPITLLQIALIFVVCAVIELVRKYTIEIFIMKWINKLFIPLQKRVDLMMKVPDEQNKETK